MRGSNRQPGAARYSAVYSLVTGARTRLTRHGLTCNASHHSLIFHAGVLRKGRVTRVQEPQDPAPTCRSPTPRQTLGSCHANGTGGPDGSSEPKKSPGRRITLAQAAAVAGIVGAIAAVVSATAAAPDLPPLTSDRPLRSDLLTLELQDSQIPQLSWNANTWKASYGIADFAVECRMQENRRMGCQKGFPAVYYALPNVNGGAEMGQADADSTQDRGVCERARYDPISLQISEGGYYCLRTPTRLVGLRPENLPMADEIVTVRIHATAWER